MSGLSDYTDAREHLDGFKQEICPDCGTREWFKHKSRTNWSVDQWNCQNCGRYLQDTLEYPCPDCGTRMIVDGSEWACQHCERRERFDKGGVLSRLSSDSYPENVHKPGVLMGNCPVCHEIGSVNGGPDGELACDECNEFYAHQYGDAWYAYGIWMQDKDAIRVTVTNE
jgi:rubrerythrin